jgi:hypothetical protein
MTAFSNFSNPYQDPARVLELYRNHPNLRKLFKCWQWLWLVVPGLYDAEPTRIHVEKAE